jgi:hypothetical protein
MMTVAPVIAERGNVELFGGGGGAVFQNFQLITGRENGTSGEFGQRKAFQLFAGRRALIFTVALTRAGAAA